MGMAPWRIFLGLTACNIVSHFVNSFYMEIIQGDWFVLQVALNLCLIMVIWLEDFCKWALSSICVCCIGINILAMGDYYEGTNIVWDNYEMYEVFLYNLFLSVFILALLVRGKSGSYNRRAW